MVYLVLDIKKMLDKILKLGSVYKIMKMKKLLLGTVIGSALLIAGCADNPEVASTTAGRIRQDEFYERLKTHQSEQGKFGEIVLQQMLIETILEESYGDQVTDEEIEAEIDKLAEQSGGREKLEELLQQRGQTLQVVKDSVKTNLLLAEAVKDKSEFSEEDVKAYHESQVPEGTKVAHILVKEEDQAKELIKELNDGADFAELAKEHSTDPGSAENGGEYELQSGQMVPEFEQAALQLEEGEMTEEPVKTQFGYHIIKMITKGEVKPFEEVKDEATSDYVQEKLMRDGATINKVLSELIQEANVQIADEDLQNAVAQFIAQPGEEEQVEDPAANEKPAEDQSEEEQSQQDDNKESQDANTKDENKEDKDAEENKE